MGDDDLRRRARAFRRARIGMIALVVGYFFLPYDWQSVIPVWMPFLLALALEAQFFVGSRVLARRGFWREAPDRGPQARDLAELGGPYWEDEEEDGEEPEDGAEVEEEPYEEPYEEPVQRPRAYGWHVVEALAAIAIVAAILFLASRPRGWDAVSETNRARAEAVFSREASRIAGHPARIVCDTGGTHVGAVQEADGLAVVGGDRAYLTPGICNTLYQVAFKHRVQSFPATGRAIAVLAHESWHLRGVANEGLANCYAFQSGVGLGVRLGLSESKARAMMREQLGSNALDSAANPEYVVPPGCDDGGQYDLSGGAGGFP